MRLLRVKEHREDQSLVCEEFEGSNIPPYAILSHTWEDEEVLFAHIGDETARYRKGHIKINHAITQARADNLQYLWVDTCCIDKTSSAELSEAINSMYKWYENADVCYAYLADVSSDSPARWKSSDFGRSRWFSRGWCLQELLAPDHLFFFSKEWTILGDKRQLSEELAQITGIDIEILTKARSAQTVSVAKRMCWAANRVTTRLEDTAYCLMGIFSVNMPMLYGEGSRAFQRLQEEIMKKSSDHSLFAWKRPAQSPLRGHGLLADSPADFASAGLIVPYTDWEHRAPYAMTNRGLQMDFHLVESKGGDCIAVLNCPVPSKGYTGFVGVLIRKLPDSTHQYTRMDCQNLETVNDRGKNIQTIFIQQDIPPDENVESITYPKRLRRINLVLKPSCLGGCHVRHVFKVDGLFRFPPIKSLYEPDSHYFSFGTRPQNLVCAILFEGEEQSTFALLIGTIDDLDLGACAFQSGSEQDTIENRHLLVRFVPEAMEAMTKDILLSTTRQPITLSTKIYIKKHVTTYRVSVTIAETNPNGPSSVG